MQCMQCGKKTLLDWARCPACGWIPGTAAAPRAADAHGEATASAVAQLRPARNGRLFFGAALVASCILVIAFPRFTTNQAPSGLIGSYSLKVYGARVVTVGRRSQYAPFWYAVHLYPVWHTAGLRHRTEVTTGFVARQDYFISGPSWGVAAFEFALLFALSALLLVAFRRRPGEMPGGPAPESAPRPTK